MEEYIEEVEVYTYTENITTGMSSEERIKSEEEPHSILPVFIKIKDNAICLALSWNVTTMHRT